MADRRERETLPENTGHPTRSTVHDKWRNSILVGPQTAGIPTVHNEDEWARPGDPQPSNHAYEPGIGNGDITGGAIEYHNTQRRK